MLSARATDFYTQERAVAGVRVRSREVRETALDEATRRIERLLGGCPDVAANLERAGAELHVIAEHQAVTDLPMYAHRKGEPFEGALTMDERGRGYGGLYACTAEEALLGLPSARHADHRDVCSHELAHTVFDFGVHDAFREAWIDRYHDAMREGLWAEAYAATNAHELFAELVMWFVGSRGDFTGLPEPRAGRDWLAAYDPSSEALLAGLFEGRIPIPPLGWDSAPVHLGEARTASTGDPVRMVFVNRLSEPMERFWVDRRGIERSYGTWGPQGAELQHTYGGHVWRVRCAGGLVGTWCAGSRDCRVVIGGGLA